MGKPAVWTVLLLAVFLSCSSDGRAAKRAGRSAGASELVRMEFEHIAMGTLFQLVLFGETAELGAAAATEAFRRIDEIERVATDYDPKSEARELVSRVGEWVTVSEDLALVIRAADEACKATEGAFDATIGPASKLWRRSLRQHEWPEAATWDRAMGAVGWRQLVELREEGDELGVRLRMAGMRLDFGGIAKGVAVDEALRELASRGVLHALMDGGGDLAALGPPPASDGWKVEVRPFGDDPAGPTLRFLLSRGAIATSGDAYQGGVLWGDPPSALVVEGSVSVSRFGHILDPRSGRALPGPRAAVMTAASAAEADAFATALTVLGEGAAAPLLYEGLSNPVDDRLRCGIFFGSLETDPCVGPTFPHDGVRLLTPHPASSKE
ncbi:FAD:protein FMN transferase [Saltatorellus ferox]|uniref:FAD:protein FMN transferase n=1 Tax=Saltatorellus ferox TaxID=2528018 RepID=UPI003AF35490